MTRNLKLKKNHEKFDLNFFQKFCKEKKIFICCFIVSYLLPIKTIWTQSRNIVSYKCSQMANATINGVLIKIKIEIKLKLK